MMATWQVSFRVSPKGCLTSAWGWSGDRLRRFGLEMEKVLPPGTGWSSAQLLWGDLEGHCFEIWLSESGDAEEASFRLDARRADALRVGRACLAALVSFDLEMSVAETGERVWAKPQLASVIRKSRAAAFAETPEAYLESLDADGPADDSNMERETPEE